MDLLTCTSNYNEEKQKKLYADKKQRRKRKVRYSLV
jgi:hypothetical protein